MLHIGGLKEKTMAAYRSGIKTVFLPADNVPDLEEIDPPSGPLCTLFRWSRWIRCWPRRWS